MRVGQPVEVEVDAYPGRTLKGHVESIQSGAGARFSLFPPENATGNYIKVVRRVPVKIILDDLPGNDLALGPGMSVVHAREVIAISLPENKTLTKTYKWRFEPSQNQSVAHRVRGGCSDVHRSARHHGRERCAVKYSAISPPRFRKPRGFKRAISFPMPSSCPPARGFPPCSDGNDFDGVRHFHGGIVGVRLASNLSFLIFASIVQGAGGGALQRYRRRY